MRFFPDPQGPAELVFGKAGGCRPCQRFQLLCEIAGVKPLINPLTGQPIPWQLRHWRQISAAAYETAGLQAPKYSPAVELLGHADAATTRSHYVDPAPWHLARQILQLPVPACFRSLNEPPGPNLRVCTG
jgi:hypothetical protein